MNTKILMINPKELIPYENNPRINDMAVDKVAESIKAFGFKVPIVVDTDYVVITGHTRLKAAKKLGLNEVPVIIADDLDENQVKAYRLADNKVNEASEWDYNKLTEELTELLDEDFDMTIYGFEDLLSDDGFGTDFTLPDGDKNEICQMTLTLHQKQKDFILSCIDLVGDEVSETFGNTNKNGNGLYEVCKQWAEQKR